jgi:hypothetical protein
MLKLDAANCTWRGNGLGKLKASLKLGHWRASEATSGAACTLARGTDHKSQPTASATPPRRALNHAAVRGIALNAECCGRAASALAR